MFLGVLYGILGCSLWGFIYIIPLLLPEYSPATVAMGRFTVYSIGSLVICYYCRKTLALLTTSDWIKAFCLGFFRERRLLRSFDERSSLGPAFRLPGC